jgi:hypothetical protein
MLRDRERTLIPYPSIVFTFGLAVESVKEFGGASTRGLVLTTSIIVIITIIRNEVVKFGFCY